MQQSASPTPTLDSPLAALPTNVLADTLARSGLHTRQVCRAFRDAHPPLLSVAPHGISTAEQLTAALAALPSSVTSLDLRLVDPDSMLHGALAAMPTTLRNLQRLTIPRTFPTTFPAILHTPQRLPHLHTLHATLRQDFGSATQEERHPIPWPALLQPPAATRLRALTLPLHALLALCKALPASLPQLTALTLLEEYGRASCSLDSADLAGLLVPAPTLRDLAIASERPVPELQEPGHLAALTTLTSLSLSALELGTPATTDDLLHAIGTLTALRSLRLLDHEYTGIWSVGRGTRRLSHLRLLTRLDVTLGFRDEDDDGDTPPVPEIVLQLVHDIKALPQLQQLQLGFYTSESLQPAWPDCHSFYARLAAATQLRHLHLCEVPLPPMEACLLTCLQDLTGLRLRECWEASPEPGQAAAGESAVAGVSWVAALGGLRLLSVELHTGSVAPLLQWHAGALPHLHTLALRDMASRDHLENLRHLLVGLQGSLVRLDLRDSPAAWDAGVLRVLGGMQRLQVLDLRCAFRMAHVQHCEHDLHLPPSLRRCYLWSNHAVPSSCQDALGRLRAQHRLVDFRVHPQSDADEW